MPVESRATDTFTRDNLLLGFSQVYFTPAVSGGYGVQVPIGILSSEELTKEVETLELERGDAGLITVDRELVSKFTAALTMETFNFRKDLFQYIIGSTDPVAVTADAAAAVAGEQVAPPGDANSFNAFVDIANGDIAEASVAVTCDTITDEAVGTGTGSANDFILDYKVELVGDISAITVAGVTYTPIAVAAAVAGNEVEVVVGETGGAHPTASGSLEFHVGGVSTPPASGAAIVATYKPSFAGADFTLNTDFVVDPFLGKIRFLHAGAGTSPFRTIAEQQTTAGQPMLLAYTYNQKASNTFKPFTNQVFEGKATIKHLTDVGVNFIWTIPSASLRITDDALTFDAAEFAAGTLQLNILDAGGTDRFGTLNLSSEPESA